tara:strand:+ start:5019 stop:5504 length:486 start_codon:yes stop_codon:yes gene_type:complete
MEHEGKGDYSDDWYTPKDIFERLDLWFDLDPCSPGPHTWVPAERLYTKENDGLNSPWHGSVFMNPPYAGRNGHVPWLKKFLDHGHGIAIVRAYTSSAWWHEHAVKAEYMLFPNGKTKFVRPDGTVGCSPGSGVVLLGMGKDMGDAMKASGIGWFVDNRSEQ